MDFSPFFSKYEALVEMAEGVFKKVKEEYVENVNCEVGCSDCCYALFDLTLIEAIYISHHFNKKYSGTKKHELIDRANRADRKIYKLKKQAQKDFQDGANEVEILGRMAAEKVRCPLLNDENQCDLYENRPITCRLYGVPTSSSSMSHTCGKSGFEEGQKYPTVNMDVLYKKLHETSVELVVSINTKYSKMGDMLVPLSMALVTAFNDDYLGIIKEEKEGENE